MAILKVAYDVICPWCWVGIRQANRLREEFPGLEIRWYGHELLPEGMDYTPSVPDPNAPKKPRVPSRFDLLLEAEGLTLPKRTLPFSRSRRALEGTEFAYEVGKADAYLDALYHTYWEDDRDISNLAVLTEVAEAAGLDITLFLKALEERTYRDRIVEFDEPSYAQGVYNVPTWMFPEEWVAEQPYRVIREMTARFLNSDG